MSARKHEQFLASLPDRPPIIAWEALGVGTSPKGERDEADMKDILPTRGSVASDGCNESTLEKNGYENKNLDFDRCMAAFSWKKGPSQSFHQMWKSAALLDFTYGNKQAQCQYILYRYSST